MSKLIPRSVIDTIRNNVDIALDIAGIACTIYIPTSATYDTANKLDVWAEAEGDFSYTSYSGMIFIDWNPNTKKLKALGLFVEGSLPILARVGNKLTPLTGSGAGVEIEVDITLHSYVKMNPEFIPSDYEGTEEFEFVDQNVDKFHDAILTKTYLLAPRRVEQ